MLKRIKPQQVRSGMFIESIEGSWANHPFWRTSFLLGRDKDIKALKSSNVSAVIINTAKGVDTVPLNAASNLKEPPLAGGTALRQALQTIERSRPLLVDMFANARMGRVVSAENTADVVGHIAQSMKNSSSALIEITRLKSRDEYTFLHSIAVSALMIHLARSIDLDENSARDIGMGGLLHDIGKMKIPLALLNKAGALTEAETRLFRRHPLLGHDILAQQGDMPQIVLDICLYHHERIDGKGYPKGLTGDQISLPTRISAICDVYDALTTERPYKKAWAPIDAIRFMLAQEGQFDKQLLMKFAYGLSI